MPNMIQSLGRDYFNQFFHGSMVLIDGKVYEIREATQQGRVIAVDVESQGMAEIAPDKFTGFKTFEYPILGYRRFGDFHIGYASKKQSVHRGLRMQNIGTTWTAATRLLIDLGAIHGGRMSDYERALALFKPKFDTLNDAPKLLEGKLSGLVLSPNLVIEPSVEAASEWYTVLYKQAVVGKVDGKGKVKWLQDQHKDLLPASLV